MTCVNKGLAIA